jgi:hypothetical protein
MRRRKNLLHEKYKEIDKMRVEMSSIEAKVSMIENQLNGLDEGANPQRAVQLKRQTLDSLR